jgi:hypothetical protein
VNLYRLIFDVQKTGALKALGLLQLFLISGCASIPKAEGIRSSHCDISIKGSESWDERSQYVQGVFHVVRQRWIELLTDRDYSSPQAGQVSLIFNLQSDGRITDMRVIRNDVGEVLALIAQKAILDPAPFPRMGNAGFREISITFCYD